MSLLPEHEKKKVLALRSLPSKEDITSAEIDLQSWEKSIEHSQASYEPLSRNASRPVRGTAPNSTSEL